MYKVLTTHQPTYLSNICVQLSYNCCSSSQIVTLIMGVCKIASFIFHFSWDVAVTKCAQK